MYASEIDGDYYKCACGDTVEHSRLLSSRNGYVSDCCKSRGWDFFEHKGAWHTKKPSQTREDVIHNSNAYDRWVSETDWYRYHRDKDYQELRSIELQEAQK